MVTTIEAGRILTPALIWDVPVARGMIH